jgi:hypothetical protein
MTDRSVGWGAMIGVPVAPRCTLSVTVASGTYLARRVVVGSTCSPRHLAPGWILSRIGGSRVMLAPMIFDAGSRVASRRPGTAQPRDSPGAALDGLAPASSRSAPGLSCGSPQGGRWDAPVRPACHSNVRVAILETCRGAGRRAPAVCTGRSPPSVAVDVAMDVAGGSAWHRTSRAEAGLPSRR